jgi:hypothetical protein
VAFANLVASVSQRTGGRIQVTLVQGPADHVVADYPEPERATAAGWNEAALANNRVEISVVARQ